jgi:glutathione synthase/RimK-type ligase-like ATP-grasp enzyme
MSARAVPRAWPKVTELCLEAAARLGLDAEVLDPEYGYLFEVRRGARRRLLLGGRSPLNDAVAARLAEDKHYTGLLLARAGLRVPETARCLSPHHPSLRAYRERAGMAPGEALAEARGLPLVVKPNRLSHGRGVQLVEDRRALPAAVRAVWALDAIALVQTAAEGRDFRLDFVDGEYLTGYERRPLKVRGDGTRRLGALLAAADGRFADPDRQRRLAEDPRATALLARRGWTLKSVIPEGATVAFEGPIQNLHGASTARLVRHLPERLRRHCLRAGEALGLRHFGVDLKLASLEADPAGATFIEVNASPLLTQIYLLGHREVAVRAQMRVLEAMFA